MRQSERTFAYYQQAHGPALCHDGTDLCHCALHPPPTLPRGTLRPPGRRAWPGWPGLSRHMPRQGTMPAEGAAIRLDMARAVALTGPIWPSPTSGTEQPGLHISDARHMVETDWRCRPRTVEAEGTCLPPGRGGGRRRAGRDGGHTRAPTFCEATPIHVLLATSARSLPTPTYHHHRLIRDDQGKRLAKRDDARALAKYRAEGASAAGHPPACELRPLSALKSGYFARSTMPNRSRGSSGSAIMSSMGRR